MSGVWKPAAAVLAVAIVTVGAGSALAGGRGHVALSVRAAGAPSFAKLDARIRAARARIGAGATARLLATSRKAGRAAGARNACVAVRGLGVLTRQARAVRGAKAARALEPVLGEASTLQRKLLRTPSARKTRCGIRAPKVVLASALKPRHAPLPPLAGEARPVSRYEEGDFVANELIVQTANRGALDGLLRRLHGTVLRETGPAHGRRVYLVRVEPGKADAAALAAHLRALDPASRGTHRVSDVEGLSLLGAAAAEAERGLTIGINWLSNATDFSDRLIKEGSGSGGGYYPNPFNLSYMQVGGPMDIGVAEAWRVLDAAGKLGNRVKVAIVDGGFATSNDFDPAWPGQDNKQNPGACGGGAACPWHGTNVASTVAAKVNNAFGVAGVAGPVADLALITGAGDMFAIIDGIYAAFDAKAKIINISAGYEIDATVSWAQVPIEDATQSARERGILVVASAGNEGRDVDAEDCFVACWEEEWIAPCENQGVLCVGGIADGTKSRAANSNYGYEWCGKPQCDVQIFAPFSVFVGPDPANAGIRMVNGTSFSSPFVAGVAALVWAGNPSLSVAEVEKILLETMHSSPDSKVPGYVNALAAVKRVVSNAPPEVDILEPAPGKTFRYGKLNLIHFVASATDPEDGKNCCTYAWSSDKDGAMGTGKAIDFAFVSPGERVVKVVVADKKGAKASKTVTLTAANTGPKATIEAPKSGTTLYRGIPSLFVATVVDENEEIPCNSVKWIATKQAKTLSSTGCETTFTLTENGSWQVGVTVKDSAGATLVTGIIVNVVDPPLKQPPLVTITSPSTGAVLDNNTTYSLKGTATDPDGTGPISYRWTAQRPGGPVLEIGTAATISWRPRTTFGSLHCSNLGVTLTLEAKDPDGTGKATKSITIGYPPC